MIGTALLVSLAVWLVVVLASRLSVRRSTSSGRGRGLAAAQVFFSLLGMVAANPSEAHESHRPAVLALAGEGTASAIGNPLARLDGPLDRPQGSLEVRRAGYALSENYGYDERVRPVVARPVSEPAIVVSSGERLGSGVPRSAKSKPLNYDAMTLLRVSHSSVATNTADDFLRLGTKDSWGNLNTLDDHFARHGADFGATSADDYARQASGLLQQPGTLTKTDPKTGVIRVYDPATEAFGAYNPTGTTRTFYRPDPAKHGYPTNLDYWNAQPG